MRKPSQIPLPISTQECRPGLEPGPSATGPVPRGAGSSSRLWSPERRFAPSGVTRVGSGMPENFMLCHDSLFQRCAPRWRPRFGWVKGMGNVCCSIFVLLRQYRKFSRNEKCNFPLLQRHAAPDPIRPGAEGADGRKDPIDTVLSKGRQWRIACTGAARAPYIPGPLGNRQADAIVVPPFDRERR